MVDAMLLAGAHGSVPGLGNVDPAGYVRLTAAAAHGDWANARVEQERLTRLFRIVDAADPTTAGPATRGVSAFKTALALLGIIDDPTVSLPLRALSGSERDRVRTHLEIAGLLQH
jgi:4-hydroxy-tetrahydrodipicolinate synthase